MFAKRKSRYYSVVIFAVALFMSACFTVPSFQKNDAMVRTVTLHENAIDYQELSAEFDGFDVQTHENDVAIVAQKNFDMSVLDELNLVGLNENEETFTVRYEISYIDNDSTVFLTVTMLSSNEIPIIETIPGLVSKNAAGEPDVMFAVDGEYLWLSDITDDGVLNETGWFKNLFKAVQKAVLNVASTVVKALAPIIKPVVRLTSVVVTTLIGTSGSAYFLNMDKDNYGIYHAREKCWQQYFGYTDFYDTVFNAVTSMRTKKFPFDINGDGIDDYILWAWKGDYLNLGAGAELGIYKRWDYSNDIWIVDKNQAMEMTLKLDYNGKNIIDWQPTDKQWWITGFNYKYPKVNRDNLTATYQITFNNNKMYSTFNLRSIEDGYGWEFDTFMSPSFVF